MDGSPVDLGAILSQKQPDGNFRPVAYASNAPSPVQQRWSCQHFHNYVYD